MRVKRTYTTWCDFCTFWIQYTGAFEIGARKDARLKGWRIRAGEDLCPCCAGTCKAPRCQTVGCSKRRGEL